ncbi:AMP-dependent synthetase and ligase [Thermincola potens JR]|uniref:AMP-dependent synthetase and ligase n=1 Tax=Thermincola potens (strain JR) TaxID=635013 RepID=D5XC79_THEPJ|nr:AMP-dependent synthetase and ligase [Thermincola potens JR]
MLLGEVISRAKNRFPDKTALIFKDRRWTYRELDEQINQVANGLKKLGIQKGDRVGLLMLNSPYFVIGYFAVVRLGAIVVPINVAFKGEEVKYLMNDSQASAMIVAPVFLPLVKQIRKELKNGWLHTGDVAYMDEEGYLFIVDRKKDLIIVGGLNVYPREIEEVIYTHPKVAEAAVVGVADALRGETVKAFIALKEGETATEREIIKYCQEKLANYKLPKEVQFMDALPKTSTGKILKRALKE